MWSTALDIITVISQIILAVATGVGVIYAIRQYDLYKKEKQPFVIIDLVKKDIPGFFDFSLHNIGESTAKNVSVSFTPNIKYVGTGEPINELGIFNHLEHLSPNKSIQSYFGNILNGDTNICQKFTIQIKCEDVEGKQYTFSQKLDPRKYLKLAQVGENYYYSVQKSLESLSKQVENIGKEHSKIRETLEEKTKLPDNTNFETKEEIYNFLRNYVSFLLKDEVEIRPKSFYFQATIFAARNSLLKFANLTHKDQVVLTGLNNILDLKHNEALGIDTSKPIKYQLSSLRDYLQ